jgi:hypothetical protein
MIVLRLLYGKLNLLGRNENDEDWLQQNFVALLRLVASPPWKHSECLKFLSDIANAFQFRILQNSLSTAASNASLIVRHPKILVYNPFGY